MNARQEPRGWVSRLRRIAVLTLRSCFRHRVIGLAAESAFFALLSLPPAVFTLVGAIGFVVSRFDPATIFALRDDILEISAQFLTQVSIDSVIAPTIDEVITTRRTDVVSIGFLIALWTGSRAVTVFIETVTLMYGYHGRRSIVRQRLLSLLLFLLLLINGVIVVPLILAGPSVIRSVLPDSLAWITNFYWPGMAVLGVGVMTSLYHYAVPAPHSWRSHLPGAVWTVIMWLIGSQLLRAALSVASETTSIYGPLSAPIAVLLWLYISSLAVLIGAALNASAARVFPGLAGRRIAKDSGSGDATHHDPSTK